MKLSDELEKENDIKSGISMGAMITGVFFVLIAIIALVLYVNRKPQPGPSDLNTDVVTISNNTVEDDFDYPVGSSKLESDDLDFWDMYKEDEIVSDKDKNVDLTTNKYEEKLKEMEKAEEEVDLSEKGTKTEVILPNGESQWVMINAYIEKNQYDYTGLVNEEPLMRYFSEAKKISKQGVRLDESYGDIDFKKLKKAGIEYCMIRVGRRGYETGAISVDNQCLNYIEAAKEEGLLVGVTFFSQAINEAEATEEANAVVQFLSNNQISLDYPVVFDMEEVKGGKSRIETLTKNQLSAIAKAFCTTIEQASLKPCIYGNKYWLLRKLDLTQLQNFDIWLTQKKDVPDYPYQFVMWEYAEDLKLEGFEKALPLSISFVDYNLR